jgi:hydroxyacylglutathione hydrolase
MLPPPQVAPRVAQQVELIPVLHDNYIVVLHDGQQAAVVDPAVAGPVIAWLEERSLELVAVLQTHHHSDHIGGTPGLLQHWPAAGVVASRDDRERIPFQTQSVGDGDRFTLLGRPVKVLAVPGHTRSHIAFHLPALPPEPARSAPLGPIQAEPIQAELFCGDTLFAGGCGQLFEGTPQQMVDSLGRLSALDGATRVWCAHEYTEGNLRWAAAERPHDRAIAERLATVQALRERQQPTIPSTIAQERATNLFVRAGNADALARLRLSKNNWSG